MCSDLVIQAKDLGKCYHTYSNPQDRLKQMIAPRLRSLFGLKPKQYANEFWALKNISFEIKKGETVGIIGRNGSGKSTLLQIICGTLNPTEGNVEVSGRVAALLELGSGFNPEFTGRENIYLNASILGLTKEEIDARLEGILNFADIGDCIDQPIKTYSTGMTLRLAFSVIANVDADILIIDEALAVGDAFFTQKCMRFLREFMKTGTVFLVSHDLASIKNLCTHAIWFEHGSIIESGSPKEVCEHYLEAFYEVKQVGGGGGIKFNPPKKIIHPGALKDQRHDFINASNLRNDLRVYEFNQNAPSFGVGGAHIAHAQLLDENLNSLAWVVGGEKVTLKIEVEVHEALEKPIIGFFVKDRLGQVLFGENTFLTYQDQVMACNTDMVIEARFSFYMPILPAGEYSVTLAIADGTQNTHIQHHWIHDAIIFKSMSSSVATGIVGIPMLDIKMANVSS